MRKFKKRMKAHARIILTIWILLTIIILLTLSSCSNYDYWDTNWNFNYAHITMANGEIISGKVQQWRDYEDGDQLQVKIDGTTYLVHSSQCTLIYDPTIEPWYEDEY